MIFDKHYKVLAIDDAQDALILLSFDLQAAGCEVICANSGVLGLSLSEQESVDIILLDMHMPSLSGLSTLEALKNNPKLQHIPVIMLSASEHEDEIVAALELGADDYVVKPYIAKVLFARMKISLRLKEKNEALAKLANSDSLTGLHNRASFHKLANSALSQAQRSAEDLVIAMLDIDLFKVVNDDYGHEAGDKVLLAFSDCITNCFRDYDILARVGGEEFAICLPNSSLDNAMLACERFRIAIENMRVAIIDNAGAKQSISITVSIGVASTCCAEFDLNNLLKQADVGLYHAKSHGRNQSVNSDIMQNNVTSIDNNNSTDLNTQSQITTAEEQKDQFNVQACATTDNTMPSTDNTIPPTDTSQELNNSLVIDGIDVELGVGNVLGDLALYKEILAMFYQDHHQDGEKLEQAINIGDMKAAMHLSHTLKGVASSVGAMTLFTVSKQLDIAINESSSGELSALVASVATELTQVMTSINQVLKSD